MRLVNPKFKIQIKNNGVVEEILEAEKSFEIEKDQSEEPNEAEFNIFNLNENTRALIQDAAENEAPIEALFTTIKKPDGPFIKGFSGEIDFAESENLTPGFVTRIVCTSQKRNHRDFWFQKAYAAGTYDDDIINDLLAAIGLPKGNEWQESRETIILSKTFAGPAYKLLQRFMFDRGFHCYIMDGKIYQSYVNVAPIGAVKTMDDYILRGDPTPTLRRVRSQIEMKTVIEVTGRVPDIFKSKTARKRRKKKQVEIYGQNDLVEYEAVEEEIKGMDFPLFLQPDFDPDVMLRYGVADLYRIYSVSHSGDDFGGEWDTVARTNFYQDDGGDFI